MQAHCFAMTSESSNLFQQLEEKLYRALELFKQNQQARRRLERELVRTKQELFQQTRHTEKTQQALKLLSRQRDEVRDRVENLLKRVTRLTRSAR